MARPSRTYTLKMSPAGVEMFLDCHYRLCRLTNEMLPYGQTLFSALLYLSRLEAVLIMDDLETLKPSGLTGSKSCFVGAPSRLVDVVSRIVSKIGAELPGNRRSVMASHLFIVALKRFRTAASDDVLQSYYSMIDEAGDATKIPRSKRVHERTAMGVVDR